MRKKTLTKPPLDRKRLNGLYRSAPFALLVTEHKDLPIPVLVLKEREEVEGELKGRFRNREYRFYGDAMQRLLADRLLARLVAEVSDPDEVPLQLDKVLVPAVLNKEKLPIRLPLNEESGMKLALLFKLGSPLRDVDRVELIARRLDRFSREEAGYWYSRIARFDKDLRSMGVRGLRVLLSGDNSAADRRRVQRTLEKLRLS